MAILRGKKRNSKQFWHLELGVGVSKRSCGCNIDVRATKCRTTTDPYNNGEKQY